MLGWYLLAAVLYIPVGWLTGGFVGLMLMDTAESAFFLAIIGGLLWPLTLALLLVTVIVMFFVRGIVAVLDDIYDG